MAFDLSDVFRFSVKSGAEERQNINDEFISKLWQKNNDSGVIVVRPRRRLKRERTKDRNSWLR